MSVERPAPKVPGSVFVTGGNGFIGQALAERLRELGSTTSGVDLVGNPELDVHTGGVTDVAPWAGALAGVDTVVHLAAMVSAVAPMEEAWQVNVLGTKHTMDAARAAGVRRFVFFSSIAAYGFDFPDRVTEDYPCHVTGGVSTYVDTKINGEQVALTNNGHGMEVVVVRPADVYGPGSIWITKVLEMAKANELVVPDGGRGVWDAIYIDNFVDAMVLLVAAEGIAGETFNISEESDLTMMDYMGELASWVGNSVRSVPIAVAAPAAGLVGGALRLLGQKNDLGPTLMHMMNRSHVVSNAKAREVLGFTPLVPTAEGLARSKAWAQQEGLL